MPQMGSARSPYLRGEVAHGGNGRPSLGTRPDAPSLFRRNPPGPGDRIPADRDPARVWITVLFAATLAAHFYLATFNWRSGFLPGHEFRQTHTALIAHYIEEENNFTPRYSVPIFGKPWSVPMEFPLYEWSVVGLSRLTHLPHHVAARTVTLACFYLTLPALWMLLGQLALAAPRRLIVLGLVLTCPVYIFYSRAFLMESMALMFSAWFLALFVRAMRGRRLAWLVPGALCGAGAGLIKSTTLSVWLLPAVFYGAWCLVRDVRGGAGWRAAGRTILWSLGAVAVPCAATVWWIRYTDAIKAPHPSAFIFTAQNLSTGNFGLTDLAARLSPANWKILLERWQEAIMSPWIIAVLVGAGVVFAPRERWRILGAAGLFLAAQLLYPFAYGLQEYYFYACAVYLLAGIGFVLNAVVDSRLAPWLRVMLVVAPFAALGGNYFRVYYGLQAVRSNGGSGLAEALKAYTPKGSVIIVVGDDWAPIIPYYSQRKALMVRSGLEYDGQYLERAFSDLADENVSALVMARKQRTHTDLVRRITGHFGLDDAVTFSHATADVYLSKTYREEALLRLLNSSPGYDQITTRAKPAGPVSGEPTPLPISPALAAVAFKMVTPAPVRYLNTFGYSQWDYEGTQVISAHPDSNLWVPPPAGARQITWEFGFFPGAYDREGTRSDGVEFIVMGEAPDGHRRELSRRLADPATTPADRGRQQIVIPYEPRAGETLVFVTRPNQHNTFDWAYTARIEVR